MRNRRAVARVSSVVAASSVTVCSGAWGPNARMIASPRARDWMNSRGRSSSTFDSSDSETTMADIGRDATAERGPPCLATSVLLSGELAPGALQRDQRLVAPRDARVPVLQRQQLA